MTKPVQNNEKFQITGNSFAFTSPTAGSIGLFVSADGANYAKHSDIPVTANQTTVVVNAVPFMFFYLTGITEVTILG